VARLGVIWMWIWESKGGSARDGMSDQSGWRIQPHSTAHLVCDALGQLVREIDAPGGCVQPHAHAWSRAPAGKRGAAGGSEPAAAPRGCESGRGGSICGRRRRVRRSVEAAPAHTEEDRRMSCCSAVGGHWMRMGRARAHHVCAEPSSRMPLCGMPSSSSAASVDRALTMKTGGGMDASAHRQPDE
jgi:hypothetical protein